MSQQLLQQDAALKVLTSLLKLLETWKLETTETPWNLVITFHGRARRLDIATLTPDGAHLAEYLQGISMNANDLETFGTPVPLPTTGTVQ